MYIANPDGGNQDIGKVNSAIVDSLGRLIISTDSGYMVLIDTDTEELTLILSAFIEV